MRSSVAHTLYLDGLYLLPPFFWLIGRWRRTADLPEGRLPPSTLRLTLTYLGAVFGVGLGAAAVCALSVRGIGMLLGVGDPIARGLGLAPTSTAAHVASYLFGLPLGLSLLWIVALRSGGVVHRALRILTRE